MLLTAVGAADPAIAQALSDPSATLTVFAPTNAAFAKLGEDTLNAVLADQGLLTKLLQKHVLGSVVPASAALQLREAAVPTLAGEDITVDGSTGSVLVTPTIVGGPSTVQIADLQACASVVHVVDEVIALESMVEEEEPACKTIAQLATETDALSTLLTAVGAADPAILAALSDPSATLTVFAPTNDAFAKLGDDALNAVLADKALLTKLLQKHVLGNVVPASAALKLRHAQVPTLAGEDITVDGSSGSVKITPTIVGGPSTVKIADLQACNSVVHVVDEVIALASQKPDLHLDGRPGAWAKERWSIVTDRVMGGHSTAGAQFSSDWMRFYGKINTNGGGFANARRSFSKSIDFTEYSGILLEVEALSGIDGAPLGLHVQLNSKYSGYRYSAAVAVPRAEEAGTPAQIYIPLSQFDRVSKYWRMCHNCKINLKYIAGLELSVLYQTGHFDLKVYSLKAVRSARIPSMPAAAVMSAQSAISFMHHTVQKGAYTYNKGYKELCIALYWSALNTVIAASDGVITEEHKGMACDGLTRALGKSDKKHRAWELRHVIDDLVKVWKGQKATEMKAKSMADQCSGVTSIGPLKATPMEADPKPACKTIAQLATETDALSTLLTAVGAADPAILQALSDPSATLTVFAPTNDAFAKLGDDALNAVLADKALLT